MINKMAFDQFTYDGKNESMGVFEFFLKHKNIGFRVSVYLYSPDRIIIAKT